MDLDHKLDILAPAARFDACEQFGVHGRRYQPKQAAWDDRGITAESTADGKKQATFRVLMSSHCEWNCPYCPLRSANDTPRATLEPHELAQLFLPRFEKGAVQGLFLSTGVAGDPTTANEQMLDGVEYLRQKHNYQGYVHLKLLPGVAAPQIERAAQLADRLSINLEAPSALHLSTISPERNWNNDLIAPLQIARDWHRSGVLKAGLSTQFVVGAAGESDRELLNTTAWLYRDLELRRVYFGAFRPALGTPLADAIPTPFVREQRLKEADWLLRFYDFRVDELPYSNAGELPLHLDPKLAWALAHPEQFPVELNTADRELLLRVPGLGPISVQRIVRLRQQYRFRDLEHLKLLGGPARRSVDFVTLDGRFFGRNHQTLTRHYNTPRPIVEQLSLW
jgi:predicted DNA-binding helix-hairpin-helix protein